MTIPSANSNRTLMLLQCIISIVYIIFFWTFASKDSPWSSKVYLGYSSLGYALIGFVIAWLFLGINTNLGAKRGTLDDELILDEQAIRPLNIDDKSIYIMNGINILIWGYFLWVNLLGEMIWAAVWELVYALFWGIMLLGYKDFFKRH